MSHVLCKPRYALSDTYITSKGWWTHEFNIAARERWPERGVGSDTTLMVRTLWFSQEEPTYYSNRRVVVFIQLFCLVINLLQQQQQRFTIEIVTVLHMSKT